MPPKVDAGYLPMFNQCYPPIPPIRILEQHPYHVHCTLYYGASCGIEWVYLEAWLGDALCRGDGVIQCLRGRDGGKGRGGGGVGEGEMQGRESEDGEES